jgi:hypothetical protein
MENITLAIEVAAKIISPIFTTGEGLLVLMIFGLAAFVMTYKHKHNR